MKSLENIKNWHCLFEQSGTFKKEFKRLGLECWDYDILNDYGQTDFVIDLFDQIDNAFEGGDSIFDKINNEGAIFAFFPCIRFSKDGLMRLRGCAYDQRNKSEEEKLLYAMALHEELSKFYSLISKMAVVCIRKEIPLVIENPYAPHHYLTRYWPPQAKIIDLNRRDNGDYYEKPTQFWFINCEPLNNVILDESIATYPKKTVQEQRGADRSLMSPDYARRFIRTYLKIYDENDVLK